MTNRITKYIDPPDELVDGALTMDDLKRIMDHGRAIGRRERCLPEFFAGVGLGLLWGVGVGLVLAMVIGR